MNLLYYLLLLVIVFLSIIIMKINIDYSPKKIKIYIVVALSLFVLRNIALLSLNILNNSSGISNLRYLVFLDYILIPLLMLPIWYIFLRSEKIKFAVCIYISLAILTIYSVIIHLTKIIVRVSLNYGFVITSEQGIEKYLLIILILFLGVIATLDVLFIDKGNVNKKGKIYEVLGIIFIIGEQICLNGGIFFFPYSVFSELIVLSLRSYAIFSFKIK